MNKYLKKQYIITYKIVELLKQPLNSTYCYYWFIDLNMYWKQKLKIKTELNYVFVTKNIEVLLTIKFSQN